MKFVTREEFCSEYPSCIGTLENVERPSFKSQVIVIPEGMMEMTKAYQELKAPSCKMKWKLFGGFMFMFQKKSDAMQFKLAWGH